MSVERIKEAVRDIPDFPEPGIIFKDITPVLADPVLFRETVDLMASPYGSAPPDLVVGIDARGFIFGAAMAYKLGAGFVPIRKEGKLPFRTRRVSYDLEYGTATVEIHEDAVRPGTRVLIVDDLLATGGTLDAAVELVRAHGGEIAGIAVLIELEFLKGRAKFPGLDVRALIRY
ncbi:MAG TPA: adenine phosphoribosyltransferase [bacterium]|nr:adenine phosphoribosyltransferase [bacterium]HPJ72737.1 adenine phosphoribosyltransferase [bacterium]HPQ65780.1 adenine phosphoribosyltransferase [bacterium]